MKRPACAALLALVVALGLPPADAGAVVASAEPSAVDAAPATPQSPAPVPTPTPSDSPLFVENVGQFDAAVRFQVSGDNRTLWLTDDALWITMLTPAEAPGLRLTGGSADTDERGADEPGADDHAAALPDGVSLRLSFVGANASPQLESIDRRSTKISYFHGNDPAAWHADVPVWGGARYIDLYPGIDLELGGAGGGQARLVVHPGASADDVLLQVDGADDLAVDGGQLILGTSVGDFTLPLFDLVASDGSSADSSTEAPEVVAGNQVTAPFAVPSAVQPDGTATTAASDLAYSTFVGGGRDDLGQSIALDPAGAAYITGFTLSTNFPTTPGAFQGTCGSCVDFLHDSYVTKISPDGSEIEYSTFLGGEDYECLYSYSGDSCNVAVDASGSAYLAGFTESADFPTTAGAYDRTCNSCDGYFIYDAFLTKLNPTGTALVYSTFLGGQSTDYSNGIALDATGAAYLTGRTTSTDFPTTAGAFQPEWAGGGYDSYVTKVKPNGSGLVYSTFLGGEDDDCHVFGSPYTSCSITVDAAGAAFVTGSTESYDFPVTAGAFDTQCDDNCFYQSDAFVTKLNATGTGLVWSTYLGGELMDYGTGVAVNDAGDTYVVGSSQSSGFPTTPGAFQPSFAGDSDWFVTKIRKDGAMLIYSTYLGGTGHPDCANCGDFGYDIAIDPSGAASVTGFVASFDFPTTPDAFQPACGGPPIYCGDAFVSRLSADGSDLLYGTYLGGDYQDQGASIALDADGIAYVTGYTSSVGFPITPGAAQPTFGGYSDAFVTKIDIAGAPACTMTGTAGDDVLTGTGAADVICGLGGNDQINGRGGGDVLIAGAGDDVITGGSGADSLQGDAGKDRLKGVDGVEGNDSLDGGRGKDRCSADPGDQTASC